MSENPLPFGLHDLAFEHYESPHPPRRVRCYVKGCEELLGPPSRKEPGDICPEHKIRCHLGSNYRTYSYANILDNVIAGLDDFAQKLRGHPFKFESNCRRFGNENSEDMLTWNVFYSFFQARRLHLIANYVTGLDLPDEPECFLWGISLSTFKAWDLLIRARLRYETTDHSSPQPVTDKLPVRRVATEPDSALWLPGKYLILFEAKFGSPNTYYQAGPRKTPCDLCKNELIEIYSDRDLQILDVERANAVERVWYQLWRGMTFSETMSLYDSSNTKAYQVSLTRQWMENKSCGEFKQMVRPDFKDRFRHLAWEHLHTLAGLDPRLCRLRRYMQQKTLRLNQAFLLGRMYRGPAK